MNKQGGLMNTELIKALKEDAEWAHANEWETPITLGDHLDAAVNAIESLQAQLAESRRQLQAAVEQIEQKMIFDAGMGREPCEICANAEKTPCIHCEPKWRGPQEAEGGETE
jgi:hypothetical protein